MISHIAHLTPIKYVTILAQFIHEQFMYKLMYKIHSLYILPKLGACDQSSVYWEHQNDRVGKRYLINTGYGVGSAKGVSD